MSRMAWAEADVVKSTIASYRSALNRLDAFDGGTAPATPKITSWLIVTGGKRIGRA
jgi:hypothetical protein